MRKYMHRTITEGKDIDPMTAPKKTVFFNKSKLSQMLKTETILSESEKKTLKETTKKLVENIPKSLEEFTDPVKSDEKLSYVKKEIEIEKKSHEQIKQKLDFKSKSLKNAKITLSQTQQKLENVMKEEFHEFENKKLEMIGKMSSKMAHDIRNPLNVLQCQIELMKIKQQKQKDKELSFSILRMESAITSITNQINDVMNFIRKPHLEVTSCDLKELVESSIAEVEFPNDVDLELYANSCIIQCDVIKIKGIVTNILQNSVEALDSKGRISLMIEDNDNTVEIKISDSGFGIPKENLEKIFDPMFTTKQTGTGLGLASCKQLLEMHGGTINVQNRPTTFTITLPKTNS